MAVSYMTEDGYNKILAEINVINPDGTLISTTSPTFFPISPFAIGVLTAIFPSFRFAKFLPRLLKPGIKVTCLKMQNMTLQRRLKALWKQNWPS